MSAVEEPQVLKIKLIPAQTSDERKRNIIANVVVEGQVGSVPYIDDVNINNTEVVTAKNVTKVGQPVQGFGWITRPYLRYYAVGPSTYKIRCPLCGLHGDGAVMRSAGIKDLSCCLSLLSCIFPVFWLCCLYTWCGCTREWTTKGLYCSNCGGKLGIERKVQ